MMTSDAEALQVSRIFFSIAGPAQLHPLLHYEVVYVSLLILVLLRAAADLRVSFREKNSQLDSDWRTQRKRLSPTSLL